MPSQEEYLDNLLKGIETENTETEVTEEPKMTGTEEETAKAPETPEPVEESGTQVDMSQNGSGHIHYLKILGNYFINRYFIIFLRCRIFGGICIVDTVDCLSQQNDICLYLTGTKNNAGIGGEIRVSRTTCEEHYHTFGKIFICSVLGKQLGKGSALP